MKRALVILLICRPLILVAQQDKLHLVMGHPFRNISTQFPGMIFQFENDSLIEEVRFSDKLILLEYIKYYPDLKYVSIVTQEHRTREGTRTFKRIFTEKPDSVYEMRLNFGEGFDTNCLKEELIDFGNNEVYDCFWCRNNKTKQTGEFGINIYTGQIREINPRDFAHSLVSGSPGGALDSWDIQLLYTNPDNGELVIPKTPIIEDRPLYPLVIPDSLQLGEKAMVGVHVNNSFFTAINLKIEDATQESIGMNHFIIFNKQTEQWHSWKIEGSMTVVRGFGKWIAGNIVASNVTLVFDEQDRLKEKIPLNRISPGKEQRRQKGTDTGTPFDLRADFFEMYYPGVLFLHNIDSNVNIKWSTNQGDSEILLVGNEHVIYRINDKIYKAPIIDGKELGQSELLIQDERVPDIHWAFYGGN